MIARRWWRPRPDLAGAWIERLACWGPWVMVRRDELRPFIMSEAEWVGLPQDRP